MTDGGDVQRLHQEPAKTGAIPPPHVGSGSAELITDTEDVGELRELLGRARERLAFYESFDRIIGENIKRSGELMLETIRMREQAEASARDAANMRVEFERRQVAERAHYHEVLTQLAADVDALQTSVDSLRQRLRTSLTGIADTAASVEDQVSPIPDTSPLPADSLPAPDAPTGHPPAPAPAHPTAATEGHRIIDALFHGVPDAATALQLQRFIATIDGVDQVEAREFAEGILRLQVTATRTLHDGDLAGWSGKPPLRILHEEPTVLEATFVEK